MADLGIKYGISICSITDLGQHLPDCIYNACCAASARELWECVKLNFDDGGTMVMELTVNNKAEDRLYIPENLVGEIMRELNARTNIVKQCGCPNELNEPMFVMND